MDLKEMLAVLESPAEGLRLEEWEPRVDVRGQAFNVERYFETLGEAVAATAHHQDRLFVVVQYSGYPDHPSLWLIRKGSIVNGKLVKDALFMARRCEPHGVADIAAMGTNVYNIRSIALLEGTVEAYLPLSSLAGLEGRCVVLEIPGHILHGPLTSKLDPVTVSAPGHDLYGMQSCDGRSRYYEVERVMLCPVQSPLA